MFWTLVGLAVPFLFYFYLIRPFTHWSRKGIQQKSVFAQWIKTIQVLLQLESLPELDRQIFNEFRDKRYIGGYQFLAPALHILDPDLIKQIAIKDFEYFVDHKQILPEEVEPLWGKNLFSLKGDRWRDMRSTLSPSFTSSKMKAMFTLMNECATQFVEFFNAEKVTQEIEMKDALTRFSNDVIASTAFGITCDSLADRNNEFYLMGKEATNLRGFLTNLKLLILLSFPKVAIILGITLFSSKVNEFFRRLVKTNIESREKNGIVRPDMIHLLIEARNGRLTHSEPNGIIDSGFSVIEESSVGKNEKIQKLTDDDLTAQALIFFFAGFESVSTLMCFLVYEIAVNSHVQERLLQEIQETLETCEGQLTYEGLLKMKYMDMVVSETLRKWPTVTGTDRICVKPYTIVPKNEGEVPIRIEKGDVIWFPIFGLHRSSKYFLHPDTFDPERFDDASKDNINPYAYIPFGAGPRSCIGNRFALLECKTIVFHILSKFELTVSEKTTVPLQLAKEQFNLNAKSGFWFRLKPRDIK